ncbi:helix-turn-helix domain-containing protein [Vibrio campbellii]|uniref:Helix-turn-helix domain-containing protein n=1 Tax=Vibrio campbellii (strain ATCC BAA-1116) TaxID=2902295 RepID=A7N5Y2_VIBC1|nr:helix-turn-helix domain-containing protein [Vibrio campbellii]ABU74861.1 hypothetical protein VIBHAR_06987 [Vibrio campbellii ATCC BAA-1116]AGU98146.1 hypothetical protein M892_17760 [Vibrio campbellii ATCC BAA-1116]MBT0124225.1 helix-turn-helix domain-containing protein [Vibrio campbellii]MBT0139168.1 helix-turn-helix domain-containing protein [Vibrio campbellii]MBT0143869.1 helix-turn-helix domain-containing protein [Vibrio campbellii]
MSQASTKDKMFRAEQFTTKKQVSLPALTTQYPEAISKFRQKYLHDNSLAWEQIKIDDVAKILNLSHATIAYLVAQKHIKVLNNAKAIHHFLFSIQDIVQFMANIYRHAVKAKTSFPIIFHCTSWRKKPHYLICETGMI